MNVLSLSHIEPEDYKIFGENIVNLAKLSRLNGVVIPAGLVVTPPQEIFDLLKQTFAGSGASNSLIQDRIRKFTKSLNIVKLPNMLDSKLPKKGYIFFKGEYYSNKKQLWENLKLAWHDIVLSHFLKGQSLDKIQDVPPAECLLFVKKKAVTSGAAFFDPALDEVVIKTDKKLPPRFSKELDNLVLKLNRSLFIPQIYEFVFDEKLFITGVRPYTGGHHKKLETFGPTHLTTKAAYTKPALKVFLNLSNPNFSNKDIEGVLVDSQQFQDFEDLVLSLDKICSNFCDQKVVLSLPSFINSEIKGSLNLMHQKKLLDDLCKGFLFLRNKKGRTNLEMSIPLVRSPEEFLQMKRELAVREISRKGTLKLWVELSTPENFLNLGGYLEGGVDGIIINLDILSRLLKGYQLEEKHFYVRDMAALLQFLNMFLKDLHKYQASVIVKGNTVIHPQILELLINKGIWGVVVDTEIESSSIFEYLSWMEKRVTINRLN